MLSYADIGERLREARKQSGFTQEDVERKLNISRVTISNIENGRSKIDSITLKRLADAYGFSVEYFLESEEEHEDVSIFFRADEVSAHEQEIVNWVRNILFNYIQLKEIYLEEI